jgi:hypothetical protein
MHALALACHPSTPCSYIRSVSAHADWTSGERLTLGYRVEGDIDQLQLPAPRQSAPAHGLWQHTCFEAFVKRGHARAYLELNFSPSTEWAIYGFDDYRRGMRPREPQHPPRIVCRRAETVFETDVDIRLGDLLAEHARGGGLRLGVACVLEDRHGQLSYWAVVHSTERADFHHPDSFTLPLPQPGAGA